MQVFDFLSSLTTVCTLFPWAVICFTYLRFRRAVKTHSMGQAIPKAARSPLQPYLATYGLAWSSVLRLSSHPEILTVVIFYGYLVFTRNNAIWSYYSDSWGYTVAPWVMIGSICLLVFAWIARNFVMERVWTWSIPRLQKVDLYNGVAPMLGPDVAPKSKLMRGLLWVLNTI
jgi:amino acid permease